MTFILGQIDGVHKYWKSEVINDLPGVSGYGIGTEGIFVTSNGVYVAFSEDDTVKLWHDNTVTVLSQNATIDRLSGFCVNGDDVYVLADEYKRMAYRTKYWKNGVVNYIPDVFNSVYSNDIAVAKDKVCVSANVDGVAKYWINGKAVKLERVNVLV